MTAIEKLLTESMLMMLPGVDCAEITETHHNWGAKSVTLTFDDGSTLRVDSDYDFSEGVPFMDIAVKVKGVTK